jgi:hypothetical protein
MTQAELREHEMELYEAVSQKVKAEGWDTIEGVIGVGLGHVGHYIVRVLLNRKAMPLRGTLPPSLIVKIAHGEVVELPVQVEETDIPCGGRVQPTGHQGNTPVVRFEPQVNES